MKPLKDIPKEHCVECGAELDDEYECSYCGTVYKERPNPQLESKTLPISLLDAVKLLMFFPFSLLVMKSKTTSICTNQKELKKPFVVKEVSQRKKKSPNVGCIFFIIIILIASLIFNHYKS